MPVKEEPYGTGFRLAWCPTCVKEYGQAKVVAVPPGMNRVVCDILNHGAAELAPPLGPREDDEEVCVYPVGRTTCGYTRGSHHKADGRSYEHPFTPADVADDRRTARRARNKKLFQIHYRIGDKFGFRQIPEGAPVPLHDEIVMWGREILGLNSLKGVMVKIVEEGEPDFIGRMD